MLNNRKFKFALRNRESPIFSKLKDITYTFSSQMWYSFINHYVKKDSIYSEGIKNVYK